MLCTKYFLIANHRPGVYSVAKANQQNTAGSAPSCTSRSATPCHPTPESSKSKTSKGRERLACPQSAAPSPTSAANAESRQGGYNKLKISRYMRRATKPGFGICVPGAFEIRSRFSFWCAKYDFASNSGGGTTAGAPQRARVGSTAARANSKQQAASGMQQAASSKQQATSSKQEAEGSKQQAATSQQAAAS